MSNIHICIALNGEKVKLEYIPKANIWKGYTYQESNPREPVDVTLSEGTVMCPFCQEKL